MKQLANKIARAILQAIVNDLPVPQREYGRAMLAELEETKGLQALVWASGGIQLWIETRGKEIMKNAVFWIGLVAIGLLAGGLYVARGFGLIWAAPVVAIGVIAFSVFRPRDAIPVALLLGISLPVAELLRVWVTLQDLITKTKGSSITDTLMTTNSPLQETIQNFQDANSDKTLLTGAMTILFDDANTNFFERFGTMNHLPQLAVTVMLSAIVIAGVSAFIRSRVAARKMISQN
jgi:hypothetical protein